MSRLSFCLLLLQLIVAILVTAPSRAVAITCPQVDGDVTPCIGYLRNGGAVPALCCQGIRSLAKMGTTSLGRRAICSCIKTAATGLSGLNLGYAVALPGKCGVAFPFKISASTDCTKL